MSPRAANRWLVKTEPSTYSFRDLERDGSTTWDGVTNAAARLNLRAMAEGDEVFVYHTGDEKAVVGIAKVTRAPRPDPKTKDPKAVVVDLAPLERLEKPVPLSVLRGRPEVKDWLLLTNSRLSVMPVPAAAWKTVRSLSAS